MAGAAGCFLRVRVCRVEARAEDPVIKLWGSLEDTKEEHSSNQQPSQAAVFEEQSRPRAGELCLAEVGGQWQRCKVLYQRGADYEVFILEQGTFTSVNPNRLRKAQASFFFPLPQHLLVCVLSGLVPPTGQHWTYSSLNYFYSLQDQIITGLVQDLLPPQGLVLLEVSEIAQQVLLRGLAKIISEQSFRTVLGCSSAARHPPLPAMSGAGPGGPWQVESMDYYYPRLQNGVTEQVVVTQVSKPHSIFCQLLSMAPEFHSLSEGMQHLYTVQTGPAYRNPLKLGQPCASRGADGRWYRSLLKEVFQESQLATVIHVDWGRKELVPLTSLRTLAAEFFRLPVITFRCALYGISDGGKDWERSVIAELRSLLQGKQVNATIQFFNSYEHLYVVTLLAADGHNLNYIFSLQVQNLSIKSDTSAIPRIAQEDGEKMGTPKLPEENFYVPKASTVDLKTGTFYDAMVEFVFDPSNFYIRTEEDSAKHQEMVDVINHMYAKGSRVEGILTKPTPGQICCAKFKDGIYYRAEVIAYEHKQVKVYFVDHGNIELIEWYYVKELPDEFKGLAALANRCCLVDIYPLGESWSLEAILAFKVAVVHRKLIIYVLSKDLDKYTVELLDQSRIEKNLGKVLSLEGHAKYEELETITIVQMGESGDSKTTPSQPVSILRLTETEQQEATVELVEDEHIHYSPYEDQLFEPGATIEVIVSHIENPGLFWCQNAAHASALNNLMDSIQMYCVLTDKAPTPDANACFAKSPKNGTWYRGFITEIPVSENKSNSVEVLYVDYGMTEIVPAVNLRAMESSFFNVKSHAFKCSLYNIIAPLGKNPFYWDSKATNAFRDFAEKASKGREFHCMFFASAFVDQELINIVDLYTPFENICANLAKRGFATYLFHKTLAPSVHLQSFYYSLHDIKTGSEEKVSITHVNPSLEFYCQLSRNTGTLERIAEAITKACKKTQRLKLPSSVPLCLAKFTDQQWYRGFICSETDGIEVFFVDYGNTEKVAADDLRPIVRSEHDLLLLPMQAIKCSLPDIPLILPEEVVTWFEDLVWDRALRALVVAKEAEGKLLVELYDGNEQINVTLKRKLGLNVPKNALACKPLFCPSSQPSSKFTQQEVKTVNGERKTCESIQGQSSQTIVSSVASTDSSTPLPKRDKSYPGIPMPFEQQAGRDNSAKYQEPSSQKRDTLPFQSNSKRALYQDNQDSNVRRKEMTKFQSSQRYSYYDEPSSQNAKSNFGKELYPKPNPSAKPWDSTPKHPITKISEISTRSITPGKKLCVYASHAKTMFDFYVQTAETGLLDQISDFLNRDKSAFEEVSEKDVNIGDVVCALFDEDKLYYRGVVEQKSTAGLNVLYIDYGNTSVISNSKIYKLPQKLCSIPAQGIHCSLKSTKGAPSSVSNSPEILETFYGRVFDQQLECEFVKIEGDKWDVVLNDKRGCVNDLLKPLEEKGKVTAEWKIRQEDVAVIKSFTWTLPKTGKTVKVFASSVDSPGYFWCQLSTTDFDVLAKQVQEAGEKSVRDKHFIATIGVGSPCNVMYSEDQNWYRALVSKMEADVITVRFVDYGNVENVVKDEIRQLPTTLASLPAQAFPCCLAGFNVAAGTWTSEGCEYFFQHATEDVLELTVENIQNDEICKIPLALVQLKYNEMNINKEMKRFWQEGRKESANLAESTSSKRDLTEGRQTVEEKQLGAEELDWPIPSMEDEADHNIVALDICHAEPAVAWQTRPENVAVIKPFTWNLPQTGEVVKVFASSVDSPDYFWCQLSTTDFDLLAKQVQEAGEKSVRDDHFIATIGVGSPCNVMYSEDQNWYRALVSKMEADVATVRFVDYGNVENVVKDEIRQLPTTLASVPAQAFPCCLAGFNVAAGTWTSEGCEYFFQHASEDVLELTVENIQNDEICKIPLALVRLKYNEMNINKEMKRFWQVGRKESSNESTSSKRDMTEGNQTVEEKQLGAEELDWPISSMEHEADHNIGFDLLNTEEAEDDTVDSSPRDLRQTATEEGISEEEGDQGIEHLVESKDDQASEKFVETIAHKDTIAEDVFETGDYECHDGLLVSYSSSLEYDDDYTKHECVAKEAFETEESATYKVVIESEEPIDDPLQDQTPEHVHKSEDTEKSNFVVLSNKKDILEGEQLSAYACVVESQELVINEDATMQILATGDLAESENEDATYVDTVEAVVSEVKKSEEAITFVDSVEALEFSDTGVCEEVEAITYLDDEDFLAIGEHQEFEAITFMDHVEPVAISEHIEGEAIAYLDCIDALAMGEHEIITFMDSVEPITDGDIGECQEIEAMTHVDSVEAEAMFDDLDIYYDIDAIAYVDMLEAVAVSDTNESERFEASTYLDHVDHVAASDIECVEAIAYEDSVEPVAISEHVEVETITCVEALAIDECEEVEVNVEPAVIGEYEEVENIVVEPVVIDEYEEVEDMVELVVIGEYAVVEDRVEPVVVGEYAVVEDRVEPVVVGEYAMVEDRVEPVVIGEYAVVEDRVEPVVTGECEAVEDRAEPVAISECEEVKVATYEDSVKAVAVGDICEREGVEDITYVDMVEAAAVRNPNDGEEVKAVTCMDHVEHAAVCDIECIEVDVIALVHTVGAENFSDIDEIETIHYMDSGEPEAGDSEEVKDFTCVTSEVAVAVGDTGEPQEFKAFTSLDNVETVAVCDTGESENSWADIIDTAVESVVVSSQVTVGPEGALVRDDCLQRDDDATGERIVKSEETVEGAGMECREETVASSDLKIEVFKTENFIGITELVRSEDCGPSEDTQEREETLSSRDVTETLEAKQWNQVWESEIDVSNEDLTENTIPEIIRDVALQHSGQQFQEQDSPGEVEGCCVGEDSENASSHTLEHQDKQPDLFTVYRDQPVVKTSPEVMYGSDGSDSSTNRETLDKEGKQPDLFTVYRDQPVVKTGSEVMYESGGDSFADQDTLDKEDKQPDLFTVCRDQPGAKTSSEVMHGSDGSDPSTDRVTLDEEDKQPDVFTVCRDQSGVKASPDVMHGSDYSTDQETLDMEDKQPDLFTVYRDQSGVKMSPEVMCGSDDSDSSTDQETLETEDKQPDLFTVYRDQPLVKTSPEVMYGSDGGDSSTDRETLDKEDKQPDIFTVCRDQPGDETSSEVMYGSDGSDSSTDQETLDKEDNQPDLFTVYRDQLGVKTGSEVMYESYGGDSLADQDTLDKEDKKAAELCRTHTDQPLASTENKNEGDLGDTSRDMDDKDKKAAEPYRMHTDQPLVVTSTENKNESDLGDASIDMDDKGKRRSDLFTVYRESPAVISSTESISGSDVSDPSVEDVATISQVLPVCCAAKVLPEDEEDHRAT